MSRKLTSRRPKSDPLLAMSPLSRDVLLQVAQRLGPEIDRVDVEGPLENVPVRDLLLQFEQHARPVEVRAAILDLIERGWLSGNPQSELLLAQDSVGLRVRGLIAAIRLQKDCGRSVGLVTLQMRPPKEGVFAARIDTGNKERDRGLNKSGTVLAALYVVGALRPRKTAPLRLADCSDYFSRLAILGIGPKTGPGDRTTVTRESIARAIGELSPVVGLMPTHDGTDERFAGWYLKSAFPDVRIVGARGGQHTTWQRMQFHLFEVVKGRVALDALSQQVTAPSRTPKLASS
jgi:hypothetical protein